MARRSQRKAESRKAKQWYKVVSPEMFGRVPFGETVANDPERVVGRIIETTLGDLTNNFSKQNTKLKFRVDRVAGDSAYTKFLGHEMTTDYVRSLVKRRTSRIDSIVDVTTTDGYQVRIKPSLLHSKEGTGQSGQEHKRALQDSCYGEVEEPRLEPVDPGCRGWQGLSGYL